MKTKNIQQEVFIEASSSEVYHAIMDSKIHSKFTGDIAKIGKNVGDSFSSFNGYATGKNLKLNPDKLIVQSWRASDWPEGHYSTIKFNLKPQNNGTFLIFNQTDIPDYCVDEISDGWNEYYWKPLKDYFNK